SADAFKEFCRAGQVEFLVARFNTDKEGVVRGALETRHVKERAMRLRQLVQREHAEHSKRRRAENRQFERDRYECRPAVERPPRDIQRIVVDVCPVLEKKAGKATSNSAQKRQLRDQIVLPTLQSIVKTAGL